MLRRALAKYKEPLIEEIRREFFACAKARGHDDDKTVEVWNLVRGFSGYAFCKAHSTAYGVEAYQSAWLKRYYPAEFMAGVLTNGKGFYHPLVYVLECHRLGIKLLPPSVTSPGPQFSVEGQSIRVPLTRVKGLTERTTERITDEHGRGAFTSMSDFHRRVAPTPDEMESMIRVGAFDCFGKTRTAQFWESHHLHQAFGDTSAPGQGWLLPPPATDRLPAVPLQGPTRRQRLEWETELLDFTASGHPLELHDHIAWNTYCPVNRLGEHVGQQVVTCGLIIEQRQAEEQRRAEEAERQRQEGVLAEVQRLVAGRRLEEAQQLLGTLGARLKGVGYEAAERALKEAFEERQRIEFDLWQALDALGACRVGATKLHLWPPLGQLAGCRSARQKAASALAAGVRYLERAGGPGAAGQVLRLVGELRETDLRMAGLVARLQRTVKVVGAVWLLAGLVALDAVPRELARQARLAAEQKAAAERRAAMEKAAAERMALEATNKRLAWTGAAMRRSGFSEGTTTRLLTQGGTVVAWGDNGFGQTTVPAGLSGVTAIAAGGGHTVAIKLD